MTIGSLFAGIGGFELGLEYAGLGPVVWQVERDAQRQTWLARKWPEARRFDDVRTVGATELGPVDIICGGFPCRGISSAGPKSGFSHPDTGLWGHMLRIIEELRPKAVVVENVSNGVPWLDRVCADFQQFSYATLPIELQASDFGAPMRRSRTFVLARHTNSNGEPVGTINAQVEVVSQHARHMGWSNCPRVDVADGLPAELAALGDACMPIMAETVGHVLLGMESSSPLQIPYK